MGQFEHDMEQRLGSFNIEPSAQVWEGVEAALHEKKKRRFIVWWWVPVAGLLLLGFGWWMLEGGDVAKQQVVAMKMETATKSKDVGAKQVGEADDLIRKKDAGKTMEGRNVSDEVDNRIEENKGKKQFAAYAQRGKEQVRFKTNKTVAKANKVADVEGQQEAVETIGTSGNWGFATQKGTSIVTANTTTDSVAKKNSTRIIGFVVNKIPAATDSNETIKSLKKTAAKNKKHEWSFVVGGGVSLVKSNNLFSSFSDEKSLDNIGSATSGGSMPTNQYNSRANNSKKLPHTGSFFLIGANYQRMIGRHWAGNIGLQYRYIQNKQEKDSTGKVVINRANWLQVPVSVQYTINPSSSIQIQLVAGASVAYSFSQRWLVVPATGNLYYDKALNNDLIANFNAGVSMQARNGYKLTLMGEQSLTPIHKNNNYKYYWRQWGAQLNMPLNKLFKQKK